jgi:hypothetical protein
MDLRTINGTNGVGAQSSYQKKQKLLLFEAFLSFKPLLKADIARRSEAYVAKDANTTPPATINPSLPKERMHMNMSHELASKTKNYLWRQKIL